MKSNLEKSVYLGLAALTFASAANGAALNVNAKSHRRVKHSKVTYKTTKKDLDQTVVFKSTGKNAIYTKPNGVKGAKVLVSKKQMQAKAKSNNVKDQFMAYQMAVNNKGYHYYKVVSFDKKIRGYVFNKGIVKTNVKTTMDIPAKKMGKLSVDNLYDEAYGAKFSINASHFNNDGKRKFTIKNAAKVNGNVYYNVADNNDSSVNGWVSADNFTAIDDANAKKDDSNNNPKPLPNPQPAPFVPTTNNNSSNVTPVTPSKDNSNSANKKQNSENKDKNPANNESKNGKDSSDSKKDDNLTPNEPMDPNASDVMKVYEKYTNNSQHMNNDVLSGTTAKDVLNKIDNVQDYKWPHDFDTFKQDLINTNATNLKENNTKKIDDLFYKYQKNNNYKLMTNKSTFLGEAFDNKTQSNLLSEIKDSNFNTQHNDEKTKFISSIESSTYTNNESFNYFVNNSGLGKERATKILREVRTFGNNLYINRLKGSSAKGYSYNHGTNRIECNNGPVTKDNKGNDNTFGNYSLIFNNIISDNNLSELIIMNNDSFNNIK
ncbi:hypothetical protein [Apilactobacillus micheneri]|uniref:hypothetical protein n=1 Tax=Apilactobacillus micheneri TaxID=1899430 RepID=UPI000D50D304|nr:hypothetical protein [Apilactobacillus micheneri]GAY79480.1 S-layer protein [Apilactobacillus micheneri]